MAHKNPSISSLYLLVLLFGIAEAATIPGSCSTPGSCVDLEPTFQEVNVKNEIKLTDGDGSNYVGLKSATTVGSDIVWTLPNADGTAGQVLKTDGSGALSWGALSGTVASGVQTNADPTANLTGALVGDVAYDTTDGELQVYDGTSWVNVNTANDPLSGLSCSDGELTKWNDTSGEWECGTATAADTIYNNNGTIGASRTVGITDTINFDSDTLILDGTNDRVQIGTGTARPARLTVNMGATDEGIDIRQSNAGSSERPLQIVNSASSGVSLYINHTDANNPQGAIRVDGAKPEIEFVETDQAGGSGKWEIQANGGDFGVNSRKFDDSGYEKYLYLNGTLSEGGQMVLNGNTSSGTRDLFVINNKKSSAGARPGIAWNNESGNLTTARLSSSGGAGYTDSKLYFQVADDQKVLQDRMMIDVDGNVGIGTTSPSDGSGSGGEILRLDTEGAIGATHYCDEDGLNCVGAGDLASGGISSESDPVAIAQIGDRSYTEDNYVVDSESVTASLDSLDQSLKDASDLVATNTTGIATNLASIGANTTSISTNTTDIGTNTTSITTNATAITSLSDEAGLGDLSCGDGELAKWNDTSGEWECGVDGVGSGVDTEPWFGTDDDAGAGSNTEDIYSLGNVLVGGIGQVGGADPKLLVRNADDALTTGNYAATELLQLSREGTYGDKWSANAQFKLGSYSNHPNARSSLEIALTNANNESVYDTVMTINGSGRVGIGTTAPTSLLHLDSVGSNGIRVESNGWPHLELSADAAGTDYRSMITQSSADGALQFRIGEEATGVDSSTDSKIIITQAGNVGIGTTNPTYKLEVSGVNSDASINGVRVGKGGGDVSTNTAVGNGALNSNTTGIHNTANGYLALNNNTTGHSNTATGYTALRYNTTGVRNAAYGYAALASNTTGYYNTANGYQSLYSNTTGSNNTSTGYASLLNNTTGSNNTANGYASLHSNTTGTDNTATGYRSLHSNTTGFSNTANGFYSLYSNTTGSYNTANGLGALQDNTTGTRNTANGVWSLLKNTTGTQNTANGMYALVNNTIGSYNTASGYEALAANTTGNHNTAMGRDTLFKNTTGTQNTAYGMYALFENTTGGANTSIGYDSLRNSTGSGNTSLGYKTGDNITTGSQNIIIGSTVDAPSATADNQLNIGNWIYGSNGNIGIGVAAPTEKFDVDGKIRSDDGIGGSYLFGASSNEKILSNDAADVMTMWTGGVERVRVDGSGNVGIGTTSPTRKLHISGGDLRVDDQHPAIYFGETDHASTEWTAVVDGGAFTLRQTGDAWPYSFFIKENKDTLLGGNTGKVGIGIANPSHKLHVIGTAGLSTGTAWTNTSDIRLKDIQGDYENGLEEVLALRAVRFNYKKDNPLDLPSDTNQIGFVAQEVQKVIPEAVTEREDGYLELNVDPIHWAMINAFKEQQAQIEALKEEINQLKSQ